MGQRHRTSQATYDFAEQKTFGKFVERQLKEYFAEFGITVKDVSGHPFWQEMGVDWMTDRLGYVEVKGQKYDGSHIFLETLIKNLDRGVAEEDKYGSGWLFASRANTLAYVFPFASDGPRLFLFKLGKLQEWLLEHAKEYEAQGITNLDRRSGHRWRSFGFLVPIVDLPPSIVLDPITYGLDSTLPMAYKEAAEEWSAKHPEHRRDTGTRKCAA